MQTLVPHTLLSSPGLWARAPMDRAIPYAAASPYRPAASGILDPRFRGDDSGNCFSRSNANELK